MNDLSPNELMMKTDVVIIGAGVVGLAVAAEISKRKRDVIVLEQHSSFGQDTSSRNSEVIHAGLYYARDSLRARLCVEGKRLLYQLCTEAGIPHNRVGKLIVATNEYEIEILENLLKQGKGNGVEDLRFCSKEEIASYCPTLHCIQALYSPSTGILDSHSLMKYLEFRATQKDVIISYNTKVTGLDKHQDGYVLNVIDANGEKTRLISEFVINCAGLHSDTIAAMVRINTKEAGYSLYYSKGKYFRVKNKNTLPLNTLIYRARKSGVGVHTVIDLTGQVKLGPKNYEIEKKIDYSVDSSYKQEVFEDCKQFLPCLKLEDLSPDMAGISPRLQGSGRDFIIAHEQEKGFPGLINLIGMDSPALTSCLAIGRHVSSIF